DAHRSRPRAGSGPGGLPEQRPQHAPRRPETVWLADADDGRRPRGVVGRRRTAPESSNRRQQGVNRMQARLLLEDGTLFTGRSFGAEGTTVGEVVFNKGMTGYQEALSDPSYCGQILTMTYPLIGNYGVNRDDFERFRPFVAGFVVRRHEPAPSNWRAQVDRKSTRLHSSHVKISYAGFCLKKKHSGPNC